MGANLRVFLPSLFRQCNRMGTARVWAGTGLCLGRWYHLHPLLHGYGTVDLPGCMLNVINLAEVWAVSSFKDGSLGCNALSWAPFHSVGSTHQETGRSVRRLVTGSCDKTVKIWSLIDGETEWKKEDLAAVHSDWVRDVAWAPSTGAPVNLIASCSEDKTVYIWTQTDANASWKRELLHSFDAAVWRVSWSVTGNVLAVSSGDHKVTLWKETLDKKWMYVVHTA